MQVGAIVADKEIFGRLRLVDDRQQRRFVETLHEAHVKPGALAGLPQLVAKTVVADGTAEGTGRAEIGHHLRDVPRRTAGDADPAIGIGADDVGQRFAESDEFR